MRHSPCTRSFRITARGTTLHPVRILPFHFRFVVPMAELGLLRRDRALPRLLPRDVTARTSILTDARRFAGYLFVHTPLRRSKSDPWRVSGFSSPLVCTRRAIVRSALLRHYNTLPRKILLTRSRDAVSLNAVRFIRTARQKNRRMR